MDTILDAFAEKVKELFRDAFPEDLLSPKAIEEGVSLTSIVQQIAQTMMRAAVVFIQMFVAAYCEKFAAAVAYRRKEGLTVHERRTRGMYFFGIGYVVLQSDIYRKGGKNGSNYHLLNEKMGLRPGARIDELTRMLLLKSAIHHSYRDSAQLVTGGEVSAQTVLNAVHNIQPPEPPLPEEKRQVREIYLFMDEDHAHRQANESLGIKTGCQMVPFVVICDGREKICEGRHRLINAHAIVPENFDTQLLLKQTESYIYQTYDMDALEKIHVYGDGASWITTALDEAFPGQVDHVHDALHRMKAIGSLNRAFPGRQVAKRIYAALEKNDIDEFESIVSSLTQLADGDAKKTKLLNKKSQYIRNQWDGMVASLDVSLMGSCTEPLVQHILADRCSTRPMGWSLKGLQNMALWRAYWYSGGDVLNPAPGSKQRGFWQTYLNEVYDQELSRNFNFDIFEPKTIPVLFDSGTQHAIRLRAAGGKLL